jgi:hypothetical protein
MPTQRLMRARVEYTVLYRSSDQGEYIDIGHLLAQSP